MGGKRGFQRGFVLSGATEQSGVSWGHLLGGLGPDPLNELSPLVATGKRAFHSGSCPGAGRRSLAGLGLAGTRTEQGSGPGLCPLRFPRCQAVNCPLPV